MGTELLENPDMTNTSVFVAEHPIRFSHTDPAGMVFYPRYFEIFQATIEDWFSRCLGVDYADYITRHRNGLPTVEIKSRFVQPTRLGEHLRVTLRVKHLGNSSLKIRFTGFVNGEKRVDAESVIVNTSLETDRPEPFPTSVRAAIEHYAKRSDIATNAV